MMVYHATTRDRLPAIQREGLRVACADPAARLQAVWLTSASKRAWSTLHTVRKHQAALADVVIVEVNVPRGWLTRFRAGLWYCPQDIPAARLGVVIAGEEFGRSVSE